MKKLIFFLVALFSLSLSTAFAAEKNKTLLQLEATKSAVETAAAKAEMNKDALVDLDRARTALKQADESIATGKSLFGFGDINPEAEKEIKLAIETAEAATASALSRIETVRASTELDAIEKQFAAVKAKLKLFEDRKAELERLRTESVACQKMSKELEALKDEKTALTAKVAQLSGEQSRADKLKIEQLELTRKVEELKAENARLSNVLKLDKPGAPAAAPATQTEDPKKAIKK
jgi:hypothetical protein